ncbi:MAG TPA: hypothetical protein DDZ04_01405 [Parabacteroides sp.]|nr:hypothetical protein [Parabacteroides sp.]
MKELKLPELIQEVLAKLEELKYSKGTLNGHRCVYKYLLEYASTIPTDEYTKELGSTFLENSSSFLHKRGEKYVCPLKSRGEMAATAIRKLGEYQHFGVFSRRPIAMQLEDWAMDDHQIMLAYDHSRAPIDTGKTPMSDRLKRLRHFYLYLESIGFRSVKYITPEIIASYLKTEAGYSKVTIKSLHKSLRAYFRFLYKYEHLPIDYSGYVPRVQAIENANIPMIWTNDDVEKLLASIDKASPVGRRNYAIFLLIAELGIRACDINALKGGDIDWDKKTIHFDQEKTGNLNVLPLSDRAGWAIIDYVRYARPQVDSPYVFLTCNAPYTQLGKTTAVSALKLQMQIAGIKPSTPGAKIGIHSLRHSLARKLLDKNVTLEDIADIMGHTEVVSSSPYLKIDVEGLRGCALSLKEVAEYV